MKRHEFHPESDIYKYIYIYTPYHINVYTIIHYTIHLYFQFWSITNIPRPHFTLLVTFCELTFLCRTSTTSIPVHQRHPPKFIVHPATNRWWNLVLSFLEVASLESSLDDVFLFLFFFAPWVSPSSKSLHPQKRLPIDIFFRIVSSFFAQGFLPRFFFWVHIFFDFAIKNIYIKKRFDA